MSEKIVEPTWFRNFKGISCGTTAGIICTIIGHPFDTLKLRLQTQSHTSPIYGGSFDCIVKTVKWEGILGLYKGISSPLAGQIVFRTCLFTTYYECLYRLKKRLKEGEKLSGIDHLTAGFITGAVASLADSPIDLLKSKLQYQIISEKLKKPVSTKYTGVVHCLKHTFSKYGFRGIYQGLGPTLIRNSIGFSLFFSSFEVMRELCTPAGRKVEDLGYLKLSVCGGLAGCIFWTANYNIDVIKSAMMADDSDPTHRKYKNIYDCIHKLYTNEGGYKRLWKGYFPCLIRGYIVCSLMLCMVDATRKYFPSYETLLQTSFQ